MEGTISDYKVSRFPMRFQQLCMGLGFTVVLHGSGRIHRVGVVVELPVHSSIFDAGFVSGGRVRAVRLPGLLRTIVRFTIAFCSSPRGRGCASPPPPST